MLLSIRIPKQVNPLDGLGPSVLRLRIFISERLNLDELEEIDTERY